MKKLEHWESGRDEMRKIPIVCPSCGKKVQVGAFIQDEKLVIENCPACKINIDAALYFGVDDEESGEETVLHPITATVKWTMGNSTIPERTTKFGPTLDIPSTLLTVLADGIQFFRNPGISTHELYEIIVKYIVANILPAEQLQEIMEICSERMKTPVEQFSVIKSNGNNGVTGNPSVEDAKEDTEDDE